MYCEKLDAPLALTFDDVLLIPAESHVEPNETDTKTRFSRNIPLNIPLVSSAMDTVTESAMAIALARNGGIGVIHRNMTAEEEATELRFVRQAAELIERNVLSVSPETSVADVERLIDFLAGFRDQTRLTIGDVTFDIDSCRHIRDGS